LDEINKNIKLYNTYFEKDQDAEFEKLKKNQEKIDNIRAKLKAGVGCSVKIAGIRRMKQTYYEWTIIESNEKEEKVNLWLVWVENCQKVIVNHDTKVLKRGIIVWDWGHDTEIQKKLVNSSIKYPENLYENHLRKCTSLNVELKKYEKNKSYFPFNIGFTSNRNNSRMQSRGGNDDNNNDDNNNKDE
jgi:hypothetical protein